MLPGLPAASRTRRGRCPGERARALLEPTHQDRALGHHLDDILDARNLPRAERMAAAADLEHRDELAVNTERNHRDAHDVRQAAHQAARDVAAFVAELRLADDREL